MDAYKKCYEDYSCYWEKLKLTGKCRLVTGGPNYKNPTKYYEVKGLIFKRWVSEKEIEWFPPEIIHEYNCG